MIWQVVNGRRRRGLGDIKHEIGIVILILKWVVLVNDSGGGRVPGCGLLAHEEVRVLLEVSERYWTVFSDRVDVLVLRSYVSSRQLIHKLPEVVDGVRRLGGSGFEVVVGLCELYVGRRSLSGVVGTAEVEVRHRSVVAVR